MHMTAQTQSFRALPIPSGQTPDKDKKQLSQMPPAPPKRTSLPGLDAYSDDDSSSEDSDSEPEKK